MARTSQRSQAPRSRGAVIVALCLATGTGITACAGSSHNVAARTPGATAASPALGGKSVDPSGEAIPPTSKLPKPPKGVSTVRPKDALAPTTIAPVNRNDKSFQPSARIKGGVQPFTRSITLKDFYVTLANATMKAVPLDVVVVTVTYGSPSRFAHLVYDKKYEDFTGPIPADQSALLVYGFSVPAADLGSVRMTIDLDGVHQLADSKEE